MFNPQVGEIPRRRERLPTPVFWPGEFHGLYGPRGHKDTDMTEQLSLSFTFTRGMKIALWGWMGLWWWRKRQPRTEPYLPLSLREWKKDAVAIKGIKGSHWEVGGNRDGNLGIPGEISNSRDQSKSLSPTEVKSDDRQGGRGVCGNYKRKLKFSCSPELYSDNLNPISEKAMATHSSTRAWKIPWVEEPDRLQSMGSLIAGHDWATSLSLFTFMHWRRTWQPTPVFLLGESQGRGSLVGCRLWGCTESDTTEVT